MYPHYLSVTESKVTVQSLTVVSSFLFKEGMVLKGSIFIHFRGENKSIILKKVDRNKPLTTAELLNELECLDDEVPNLIYITSLNDNGNEKDEDSGEEDCNDPNKLNPRQLQSKAETDSQQDEYFDDEESEKENDMENYVIEAGTEQVSIRNKEKLKKLLTKIGTEKALLAKRKVCHTYNKLFDRG
ncbi:hypothetical protein JTB14_019250 [Gonioctena quinquepunctata]|nr:hypothetical protein JTB14_019250 [Gonioctena quinquepunctata]